MLQENFNGSIDPDEVLRVDNPGGTDTDKEDVDDETSYDILPSNGPGLTGDDGEQVVETGEVEEDDDEEDEDDEDEDDEEDDDKDV